MSRKSICALGFAVAVFGAFCWQTHAVPAPAPATSARIWEYKVIDEHQLPKLPEGKGQLDEYQYRCERLNKVGAEGWELVAVQDNGVPMVFYFKRPKEAK